MFLLLTPVPPSLSLPLPAPLAFPHQPDMISAAAAGRTMARAAVAPMRGFAAGPRANAVQAAAARRAGVGKVRRKGRQSERRERGD